MIAIEATLKLAVPPSDHTSGQIHPGITEFASSEYVRA
jgi:hypothetical protein